MAPSSSLHQPLSILLLLLVLFLSPIAVRAQSSGLTSLPTSSPSTASTLSITASSGSSSTPPTSSSSTLLTTSIASTPAAAPTSATPTLSVVPSASGYTYYGCWNETTGNASAGYARALPQNHTENDYQMTVDACMQFGSALVYKFCGLEYGRECWCAPLLNSLSVQLPNASCDLPCVGQEGTACGGEWRLSVYEKSSSSGAEKLEVGGGVIVAIVLGVVIAYMVLA